MGFQNKNIGNIMVILRKIFKIEIKQSTIRTLQKWAWAICRAVLMCGLSFIVLYPIAYMVSMAFRPIDQMADPSIVWIPKSLTFENIKTAIGYLDYAKKATYTGMITIVCTLLQIITASLAGYGMSRFNFKGKNLLFGLLILSILVPPQNIILSMFRQYQTFNFFGLGQIGKLFTDTAWTVNLIETPWSMILPAIFGNGIRSGLIIFIFMQFMKGLPVELEDAAYVDGCGVIKTYARIIIPNAVPALITVFIFSIVWYWTDYFYASVFIPNQTLTVALQSVGSLMSSQNTVFNPWAHLAVMQAGCLLVVFPPLVLYLFVQRFFVQSVERTGITG